MNLKRLLSSAIPQPGLWSCFASYELLHACASKAQIYTQHPLGSDVLIALKAPLRRITVYDSNAYLAGP